MDSKRNHPPSNIPSTPTRSKSAATSSTGEYRSMGKSLLISTLVSPVSPAHLANPGGRLRSPGNGGVSRIPPPLFSVDSTEMAALSTPVRPFSGHKSSPRLQIDMDKVDTLYARRSVIFEKNKSRIRERTESIATSPLGPQARSPAPATGGGLLAMVDDAKYGEESDETDDQEGEQHIPFDQVLIPTAFKRLRAALEDPAFEIDEETYRRFKLSERWYSREEQMQMERSFAQGTFGESKKRSRIIQKRLSNISADSSALGHGHSPTDLPTPPASAQAVHEQHSQRLESLQEEPADQQEPVIAAVPERRRTHSSRRPSRRQRHHVADDSTVAPRQGPLPGEYVPPPTGLAYGAQPEARMHNAAVDHQLQQMAPEEPTHHHRNSRRHRPAAPPSTSVAKQAEGHMETPVLAQLQVLLRRKRQHPHNDDVMQEFLMKGMSFFVEGKEKCWWCVPAKRRIATDMLHILSMKKQTTQVGSYKAALAEQLSRCTACIGSYYESKTGLREHYTQIFAREAVNDFFLGVEQWDAWRITQSFGRAMVGDGAPGLIVLFETLCSAANLLYYPEVAEATFRYITSRLDSGSTPNIGTRLLPGVIALSVCDDLRIQQWAWRALKPVSSKHSPVSANSVVDIFACLLRALASRENPTAPHPLSSSGASLPRLDKPTFSFASDSSVWCGLRIALGKLSDESKQDLVLQLDGFPVIVLKILLGLAGFEFVDCLRVFADIIGVAERQAVWPKISQLGISPADFALFVLKHKVVRGHFYSSAAEPTDLSDEVLGALNRKVRPALEWVTPFISSLSLPDDSPAIVALLNGLLYDIRSDPRVPLARAALAVHTGMAIVAHCFKLPPSEKCLADGSFVLGEFLEQNLGTFVDIVQGRDPISQSELLIASAESLVDTMLREDLTDTVLGISTISKAAQTLRDSFASQLLSKVDIEDSPPVLVRFLPLWKAVLTDPQNINIVKKALFAASYFLLFDPLPEDLVEYLPAAWRVAYECFEKGRSDVRSLLKQYLEVVARTLEGGDAELRIEFEHSTLDSLLRLLASPVTSLHHVALSIMRGVPLDSGDDDDIDNSSVMLSSMELDMTCYELLKRHSSHLLHCLTEVTSNCKLLVNHSRPAYSSSTNTALLARSAVLAVTDLADSKSTEAVAGLFFSFCDLLGAILKASSENAIRIDGRGIYTGAVAVVFQTVYSMLNTMECSDFVRAAKGSSSLDENESFHKLSVCVSEMLNYLEGNDEPEVSADIIKAFGLIANGLSISPGIKMLCPRDTVLALVQGSRGYLTSKQRQSFADITAMPVWEKRAYAISKTRPVQIIFDDEEALAAVDDCDLCDLLSSDVEIIDVDTEPATNSTIPSRSSSLVPAPPERASLPSARLPVYAPPPPAPMPASSVQTSAMNASRPCRRVITVDKKEEEDEVVEVQFAPGDTAAIQRKRQTSMDFWLPRSAKQSGTASAPSTRPLQPAVATTATKSKKSGPQSVFGQLRSSFAQERKSLMPSTASIPRQVVKAPRSMATVPADAWASEHFNDPYAPSSCTPTIHARDVSKAALEELEREKIAKSKLSVLQSTSDDSDSSSSDDDDDNAAGAKKGSSGLAGLMNIRKLSATRAAPRRTMMVLQPNGDLLAGGIRGSGGAGTGLLVTREAREQALAKQREKMRLRPSMNLLHKRLLGWEFEATGDMPPDMTVSSFAKVPDWFESPAQYSSVLEPLFMLECWAQFQRAKEEAASEESGEGVLLSRTGVDDFQDLTFEMSLADVQSIYDNDVVVFSETLSREKRAA
ncbi:DEAD-box type RNA helicase, partial [Coemansia sp. BCRC 34301]